MKAIRQIKKIKNNEVVLTIPPGFSENEVEVLIISRDTEKQYHFNDLAGKLKWQGDPVNVVREIRNEWQ
jgi:hypothetical protein